MYYVYILFSKKLNKFYIGRTEDLKRRIYEHNNGYSDFTSSGGPLTLTFYEAFSEKKDSINEEIFLKTGQGKERRKYLLKNFLEKNNL